MREKGNFSLSSHPFPFPLGGTAGFEGKREKPFPPCSSSPLTGAEGFTDEDITGKTATKLLTINVFMGHFNAGVDLLVVWTCPSSGLALRMDLPFEWTPLLVLQRDYILFLTPSVNATADKCLRFDVRSDNVHCWGGVVLLVKRLLSLDALFMFPFICCVYRFFRLLYLERESLK